MLAVIDYELRAHRDMEEAHAPIGMVQGAKLQLRVHRDSDRREDVVFRMIDNVPSEFWNTVLVENPLCAKLGN